MKRHFDYKLTISLVGFFIGVLLIALSKSKKALVGGGFIVIGLSLAFFAFCQVKKYSEQYINLYNEYEEYDGADEDTTMQYMDKLNYLKKQKKRLMSSFWLCSIILIICGIVAMVK